MKNLYFAMAVASFCGMNAMAQNGIDAVRPVSNTPMQLPAHLEQAITAEGFRLNGFQPQLVSATATDPGVMNFENVEFTESQLWYLGDMMGDGTAFYYLFLSNCGITSEGGAGGEGEFCYFLINDVAPASLNDLKLTAMEYTPSEGYGAGTYNSKYSSYQHCVYYDPGDGSQALGAYVFKYMTGNINVSECTSEQISVSYDLNAENWAYNESYEYVLFNNGHLTANYQGALTTKNADPSAYPTYPGDASASDLTLGGRMTSSTNYVDLSMTLYNCPVDDGGFVAGAGDLLNVELLVPVAENPIATENLVGTYTYQDMMGGGLAPGHYLGGIWYEMYGSYYPLGTCLYHINDNYGYDAVALAVDGTITISALDEQNILIDFDLISAEGNRITSQWAGSLYDNSAAQGTGAFAGTPCDITAIKSVKAEGEACYYNLAGQRVGKDFKGLMIKK